MSNKEDSHSITLLVGDNNIKTINQQTITDLRLKVEAVMNQLHSIKDQLDKL